MHLTCWFVEYPTLGFDHTAVERAAAYGRACRSVARVEGGWWGRGSYDTRRRRLVALIGRLRALE